MSEGWCTVDGKIKTSYHVKDRKRGDAGSGVVILTILMSINIHIIFIHSLGCVKSLCF